MGDSRPTCKTCRFWNQIDEKEKSTGVCERSPPVLIPVYVTLAVKNGENALADEFDEALIAAEDAFAWAQPTTHHWRYCGEHRPCTRQEDAP